MRIFAAAVFAALLAAPAGAESLGSGDDYIDDRLLAAAISDEIRKRCDSISPRIIRFYFEVRSLKRYANEQGFSDEEISEFLDSEENIEYFEGLRDAYLESKGAVPDDDESYCAVGRGEIDQGTLAGSLIWSR